MDTNFQHLTHYIRTIINCKYTTHVAIISHTINNISCHNLNIIDIYLLYMFKKNQPKETMTIDKKTENIMDIISQYLDDYTLEEFWKNKNSLLLTDKGLNLYNEIKKEIKK